MNFDEFNTKSDKTMFFSAINSFILVSRFVEDKPLKKSCFPFKLERKKVIFWVKK